MLYLLKKWLRDAILQEAWGIKQKALIVSEGEEITLCSTSHFFLFFVLVSKQYQAFSSPITSYCNQ